jgi:Rrf2 family protein
MVNLAMHWEQESISTRAVSNEMHVPYQLACKLMQKLHKAKLIKSIRGPKGGFRLSKNPSRINLLEIIETIQGPVSLNRCLMDVSACTRQRDCQVNKKLAGLQKYLITFLSDTTLNQLL